MRGILLKADLLQGFYLGNLLVEPLKGQVTSRTGARHLPSKAVEVLLCLAEVPGELVSRETLLDEVWGSGHGSQEALSHAISEIRHALDDHRDDPVFLQTLPKRGYRLVITPRLRKQDTPTVILGDIGLLEDLNRRGVLETVLAYLVVGWLLIQIADIVFSQLHLPDWTGTFVTLFVIAGFPIAIILSWFLEFRDGRAVVHKLSATDLRKRRFSRTYISVLSAFAVAAVLVFVYDSNFGLPVASDAQRGALQVRVAENSIAVLPFFNIDGSDETQTFANGFADDITMRLSRVPGLLVSSRGDAFTLEPNSTSAQVRQRLRVAMYLEGSVQIADDRIRVIVQLIDSESGFHVLSRSFDRPREDFFKIRDDVTELTVSSLRVALPESTQKLSWTASADPNLDAYILYRRGIDESNKPRTATTISGALGWFDAALDVDPEYAAAHAGRCSSYISRFEEVDDLESMTSAENSCARALELNPNLDIVHTALGELYEQTGRYDDAEIAHLEALRINPQSVSSMTGLSEVYRLQKKPEAAEEILWRAIGLQPGNWEPYNALGVFLYRQGRYTESADQFANVVSIDEKNMRGLSNMAASHLMAGNFDAAAPVYQRALDIEPDANTYANLGLMYYYLGQYDMAEDALLRAITLTPNAHINWMNLGDILFVDGQQAAAHDAFTRAEALIHIEIAVNPNDPTVIMDLAWIQAMLGNKAAALTAIEKAVAAAPDDPYADYIRALIQHHFGDIDATLESLRRATAKGYSRTILGAEPHLMALRGDPRFEKIINAD